MLKKKTSRHTHSYIYSNTWWFFPNFSMKSINTKLHSNPMFWCNPFLQPNLYLLLWTEYLYYIHPNVFCTIFFCLWWMTMFICIHDCPLFGSSPSRCRNSHPHMSNSLNAAFIHHFLLQWVSSLVWSLDIQRKGSLHNYWVRSFKGW